MCIPIITSLVCFAVATILFTPPLRKFPFYQAVSFYFLFEGAWTLFNTLITAIWPYADFMIWVHHVGIILFAGYLFYKIYVYYWRQRREEKRETEQAVGAKELSKANDEEKKQNKIPPIKHLSRETIVKQLLYVTYLYYPQTLQPAECTPTLSARLPKDSTAAYWLRPI